MKARIGLQKNVLSFAGKCTTTTYDSNLGTKHI